ncbi:acriflavin resistance protein [Propionigenium maris DSM 9537]|uniref:Acriflavin resistance protein n=1 Tax=Propionigenium maris DSM 9537 TaxID=1123000 RepID=A0A9W6GJW3_9FUSO|nr:efflux RND transporter permease subunit [Propionigenium maris]GLI55181.1 acriflavin resistance protein [Propionigenium maris DSM 9537]
MKKKSTMVLDKIMQLNKGVIVIYIMLIFGGVYSLFSLPTEFYPNFDRPSTETLTVWEGASSSEVEKYISKPLEDLLYTLDDVYKITSNSSNGKSVITTEFNYGIDADIKALMVQNEIQNILNDLPTDLDDGPSTSNGLAKDEVISYNIFGNELWEVSDYAKNTLKRELEGVEGIGSVVVEGALIKKIDVALNTVLLSRYDISVLEIVEKIRSAHSYIPLGEVKTSENNLSVLYDGKLKNIENIEKIVVRTDGESKIYLKDIAKVEIGYRDLDTIYTVNGKNAVYVKVLREEGEDFIEVAQRVREKIEEINLQLPSAIEISEGEVPADEISTSVSVLKSNGAMGFFLAIIVIFVFLRNLGASGIIGISIPTSFLITFLSFKFFDVTLNMLTLMGLSLGVGMLVDNSVVVLDSIESHVSKYGKSRKTIEEAVSKVISPITAATITSVIVFVPIFMIGGMATEIFKDMAFAIIASITASLIVAATLIPIISETFSWNVKNKGIKLESLKYFYEKILMTALRRKYLTIVTAILILFSSFFLITLIDINFLADSDEGYYGILVETPRNYSLTKKDELTKKIDILIEEDHNTQWYSKKVSDEGIIYNVALVEERSKSAMEIRDSMRNTIGKVPDAKLNYFLDAGYGSEKDIELSISSKDINLLKRNMDQVIDSLSKVDGITDITSSYKDMLPQMYMSIDREKLRDYGLTEAELNEMIAVQVNGIDATYLNSENDKVDIVVRLNKIERDSIKDIRNIYVDLPNGGKIKLNQLVDLKIRSDLTTLSKENRNPYFNFSANVKEGYRGSIVKEKLLATLNEMKLPHGINFRFIGEAEDQSEVMTSLAVSFIAAIGLIYFVLVLQFNSVCLPLIIMGAIPLSFTGVLFGLFITNTNFDILAMIGVIILSGVIVNNSLVLIEYIRQLELQGIGIKEAILEGGKERIRPILITTFTTVIGMIPMTLGVGQGSEIYIAMARGMSTGLILSTLLTLIVIPTLYYVFREKAYQRDKRSECSKKSEQPCLQ